MKLPDKVYDTLKWVALVVIPATATFYSVIAGACNLPYADVVCKIGSGSTAFIGTLIGISAININKENK